MMNNFGEKMATNQSTTNTGDASFKKDIQNNEETFISKENQNSSLSQHQDSQISVNGFNRVTAICHTQNHLKSESLNITDLGQSQIDGSERNLESFLKNLNTETPLSKDDAYLNIIDSNQSEIDGSDKIPESFLDISDSKKNIKEITEHYAKSRSHISLISENISQNHNGCFNHTLTCDNNCQNEANNHCYLNFDKKLHSTASLPIMEQGLIGRILDTKLQDQNQNSFLFDEQSNDIPLSTKKLPESLKAIKNGVIEDNTPPFDKTILDLPEKQSNGQITENNTEHNIQSVQLHSHNKESSAEKDTFRKSKYDCTTLTYPENILKTLKGLQKQDCESFCNDKHNFKMYYQQKVLKKKPVQNSNDANKNTTAFELQYMLNKNPHGENGNITNFESQYVSSKNSNDANENTFAFELQYMLNQNSNGENENVMSSNVNHVKRERFDVSDREQESYSDSYSDPEIRQKRVFSSCISILDVTENVDTTIKPNENNSNVFCETYGHTLTQLKQDNDRVSDKNSNISTNYENKTFLKDLKMPLRTKNTYNYESNGMTDRKLPEEKNQEIKNTYNCEETTGVLSDQVVVNNHDSGKEKALVTATKNLLPDQVVVSTHYSEKEEALVTESNRILPDQVVVNNHDSGKEEALVTETKNLLPDQVVVNTHYSGKEKALLTTVNTLLPDQVVVNTHIIEEEKALLTATNTILPDQVVVNTHLGGNSQKERKDGLKQSQLIPKDFNEIAFSDGNSPCILGKNTNKTDFKRVDLENHSSSGQNSRFLTGDRLKGPRLAHRSIQSEEVITTSFNHPLPCLDGDISKTRFLKNDSPRDIHSGEVITTSNNPLPCLDDDIPKTRFLNGDFSCEREAPFEDKKFKKNSFEIANQFQNQEKTNLGSDGKGKYSGKNFTRDFDPSRNSKKVDWCSDETENTHKPKKFCNQRAAIDGIKSFESNNSFKSNQSDSEFLHDQKNTPECGHMCSTPFYKMNETDRNFETKNTTTSIDIAKTKDLEKMDKNKEFTTEISDPREYKIMDHEVPKKTNAELTDTKKKKSRFPIARIKRIMQSDEEIGKVSTTAPVVLSRAIELFLNDLISKMMENCNQKSRKIDMETFEKTVNQDPKLDFLKTLLEDTNNDDARN